MLMLDILLPVSRLTFLTPCLDSIFKSTDFKGIKANIILVDTAELMNEFDISSWQSERVQVIKLSAPGASYSEALMLGSAQLRNPYVSLMNDDDLVHKNKFANQISLMKSNEYDLVIGRLVKIPMTRRFSLNFTNYHSYNFKFLGIGPFGANASIMMKRDWWDKNRKLHRFSTPSWDWIFAMQTYPSSRIAYSPRSIYFYRQHASQITKTTLYKNELIAEVAPYLLRFWEKHANRPVESELIFAYAFPKAFWSKRRYSLSEFYAAQLALKDTESSGLIWQNYQTLARWIVHRRFRSQNFA